jgi:hypothetical protein
MGCSRNRSPWVGAEACIFPASPRPPSRVRVQRRQEGVDQPFQGIDSVRRRRHDQPLPGSIPTEPGLIRVFMVSSSLNEFTGMHSKSGQRKPFPPDTFRVDTLVANIILCQYQ